ncbi:MAG: hypothetical protein COW04_00525 [Deltaproteobacteria bacterium CG12_big_fil_rev_8_21_14_0_65_43_10]|nr:MAG: hypothetical protein AUK23_03270 [Deltaproteobacteria bacterium CG2_30_43_15]PIQ46735.1 MAG: hypothetical protein COW04_00525 [Deltaproteobacteria bacterium CG12_big_fil_rev_8_21_14_0_65_43_10]PIU86591.1 MAG: hypothetical protein COS67_01780 [Deltaproteobacteria bacterium CG06_land_8_20_14_3_00_44_19]PIX24455.1 MAG: hypothetical protein COZ68_06450 [Deltaproteobacteria bacterium CG_4_8_14_3_um_filter_43_13]PIZ19489.1 MAG: hypothetical protein COY50_09670 [Deltaproteobacteria bacterium C
MALFERNKNIRADIIGVGLLKVEVSMLDNVHHISTTFHISFPSREIKHAEADFKKAPYLGVCRQTSQKMANLVGIKINSGFTERIIESVGGKDGCHHLVDQTLEMAKSMAQFIDNSYNFPIREYIEDAALMRKKVLEVYPQIKDMCWAYKVGNDHLFTKDIKCGLQEDLVI